MSKFPFFHQHDNMDCGATCLRMVAKYYGKNYSLEILREKTYITREGVSMLGISEAAENIGFRTLGVKISFEKLQETPLPCIVHWNQNHFIVVYEIKVHKSKDGKSWGGYVRVADLGQGLIKYTVGEFMSRWLSSKKDGEEEGIALLFETTPEFYNIDDEKPDKTKFKFILQYLRPYKKLIVQLFGDADRNGIAIDLPIFDPKCCRLWNREQQPEFYCRHPHRAAHTLHRADGGGVHPFMDIIAYFHPHQHFHYLRFFDEVDEATVGILRHKNDRGFDAAHRRPPTQIRSAIKIFN